MTDQEREATMTDQQRIAVARHMARKLLADPAVTTWEERWLILCGCLETVRNVLPEAGLNPTIAQQEFADAFARHVIDALAAPPIEGHHQVLFYITSSDPTNHEPGWAWVVAHPAIRDGSS